MREIDFLFAGIYLFDGFYQGCINMYTFNIAVSL